MRQQKSGGKLAKKANHIATHDEATSYKSNYPFFFGSNYKSDGNKKASVKVRVVDCIKSCTVSHTSSNPTLTPKLRTRGQKNNSPTAGKRFVFVCAWRLVCA